MIAKAWVHSRERSPVRDRVVGQFEVHTCTLSVDFFVPAFPTTANVKRQVWIFS
jgi:hypothetical protein